VACNDSRWKNRGVTAEKDSWALYGPSISRATERQNWIALLQYMDFVVACRRLLVRRVASYHRVSFEKPQARVGFN